MAKIRAEDASNARSQTTELQFLGGASTVTGSKYLITHGKQKILVDCGLFQGLKSFRLKNWDRFPIDPAEIDAIILTHAHIDHSGYIPRMIKEGFCGKIFSTPATRDACGILLPDCGYLQEEEADYLNRKKRTKHSPALPLFSAKEAEESLEYFESVDFGEVRRISDDISFELSYAGHILGAASAIVTVNGKRIGFTGDVGRLDDSIFYPPSPLPELDYLITESTYGNRLHKVTDPLAELEQIINESYERQGAVIIPAFAVGRAQTMMHYLSSLKKQKRIPSMPMYLNSPMATDFTAIFRKYEKLHRLSPEQCAEMAQAIQIVHTAEDSKALNQKQGPMIIISASGMLTGGRVLHHLKAFAPFAKNTILLTGFQSAGTRGDSLQNGAEEIKIHGEYVPVRAQVKVLDNMSAHADYRELIQWFEQSKLSPRKVFITHGEPTASDEFRRRLTDKLGWSCCIPEHGEKFVLK